MGHELLVGPWQETLRNRLSRAANRVDCLIADAPFSKRTHNGHNDGEENVRSATGQPTRTAIHYKPFTAAKVKELVCAAHDMARGWLCFFCDHPLIPAYEKTMQHCGRIAFAPLPVIVKQFRNLGDGPASWATYLMVSRPRSQEWRAWRSLPGGYFAGKSGKPFAGAKSLDLMREIVCDYTNQGMTICDTHAGTGTTLEAGILEGCNVIGSEVDPYWAAYAQNAMNVAASKTLIAPRGAEIRRAQGALVDVERSARPERSDEEKLAAWNAAMGEGS